MLNRLKKEKTTFGYLSEFTTTLWQLTTRIEENGQFEFQMIIKVSIKYETLYFQFSRRLDQACFSFSGSWCRVANRVPVSVLGVLCLLKQSRQYTGLPAVGLKGTVAVLPQSLHLISVLVCWDIICYPVNLSYENSE